MSWVFCNRYVIQIKFRKYVSNIHIVASCMVCKRKVNAESIKEEIFNQTIPKCGLCPEPETDSSEPEPRPEDHPEVPPINFQPQQLPVMKPDIVFFGEGLPDHFHECISR